jgi:hypothetical protein
LEELIIISKKTAAPSDNCFQYIGTIVDNTIGLLTAPANSLDGGNRRISFNDDNNWVSLMQAVHRSFLSSIQTSVERALAESCKIIEIKSKKKINSLLKELDGKLTNKQIKLIESLAPKKPSFDDYLEASLKNISSMAEDRKKIWRKYFKCLSILRNKVSHSDCSLSTIERESLVQNGFASLVNGNELQFNSRLYSQICDYVIQFFQELGHTLKH